MITDTIRLVKEYNKAYMCEENKGLNSKQNAVQSDRRSCKDECIR